MADPGLFETRVDLFREFLQNCLPTSDSPQVSPSQFREISNSAILVGIVS